MPEGHRPVIVRYRAISFMCPSDSRAIIGRYHTIVRGLAGISPNFEHWKHAIRRPGSFYTSGDAERTLVSHLPMPVRGLDDIGNVGQTITGTGPVAVRLGPVDKSTKKSPMAGQYEGLSDRHPPKCVGFDSDELPITKSSEEYNSALKSSDALTEVCFTLRCRPSICGSPYDFPIF